MLSILDKDIPRIYADQSYETIFFDQTQFRHDWNVFLMSAGIKPVFKSNAKPKTPEGKAKVAKGKSSNNKSKKEKKNITSPNYSSSKPVDKYQKQSDDFFNNKELYKNGDLKQIIELYQDLDPTVIIYVYITFNKDFDMTLTMLNDFQTRYASFVLYKDVDKEIPSLDSKTKVKCFFDSSFDVSKTIETLKQIEKERDQDKQDDASPALPLLSCLKKKDCTQQITTKHAKDMTMYPKQKEELDLDRVFNNERHLYTNAKKALADSWNRYNIACMKNKSKDSQDELNKQYKKMKNAYYKQIRKSSLTLFAYLNQNQSIRELLQTDQVLDVHGLYEKEVENIMTCISEIVFTLQLKSFRINVGTIQQNGDQDKKSKTPETVVLQSLEKSKWKYERDETIPTIIHSFCEE